MREKPSNGTVEPNNDASTPSYRTAAVLRGVRHGPEQLDKWAPRLHRREVLLVRHIAARCFCIATGNCGAVLELCLHL